MKKKITTISLSTILIIAFSYSLITNLRDKNEKIDPDILLNSSGEFEPTSLLNEVVVTDGDDGNIGYHMIDESEFEIFEENSIDDHGHAHDDDDQQIEVMAINRKAPEFELQTLEGESVKLSNYKGKRIFINFWATWCPPCVKEMPEIQHYFEEHPSDKVALLSINITDLETNRKTVEQFATLHGLQFPILLDEVGEVSKKYEILTIPTSYIVDEKGMIVEEIIGPVTEEFLIEKFGS